MFFLIYISFFFAVSAGPPVFNDDISNITAKENMILKVRCSATGDPDPTYEWFNEHAQEVGPHLDPPIWIENCADSGTLLVFNGTSMDHSGGYTCVAQNSHGLRSKVFEINIIAQDDGANITVLNVTDTEVTFGIVPHGNDEAYDLKYKEIYENVTYYSKFTDKNPEIKISRLIPSGQYSFNFSRILKDANDKEWTLNLTITLLPAKPEVIFHKLNDGILTISWFRVFDDFMRKTIDKYELSYISVSMVGGRSWRYNECGVSIEIPSCAMSSSYTLANLYSKQWYEIRLRAYTSAGYGEPFKNKIYVP